MAEQKKTCRGSNPWQVFLFLLNARFSGVGLSLRPCCRQERRVTGRILRRWRRQISGAAHHGTRRQGIRFRPLPFPSVGALQRTLCMNCRYIRRLALWYLQRVDVFKLSYILFPMQASNIRAGYRAGMKGECRLFDRMKWYLEGVRMEIRDIACQLRCKSLFLCIYAFEIRRDIR